VSKAPAGAPKVGVHVWRLSAQTNLQFEQLLRRRYELNDDDSDEAYALEDEIRSLPGFPHPIDPDTDIIVREVTTI
jgi:hypothetical protein